MNLMVVIICVPFYVLLERKVLSYMNNRKGPNKVSIIGLLQPIADGVKLMMKNSGATGKSNLFLFLTFPLIKFLLVVLSLQVFPVMKSSIYFNLIVVMYILLSSLTIYSLLGSGWSSKCKYSLLGSLRASAQTVSYEINFMMVLLLPCCSYTSYALEKCFNWKGCFNFLFLPFIFIWVMIILMETNRSPFDFAEGESELVSGFNTEYSSLPFTFLFLSEYGSMMFLSYFSAIFFLNFFLVSKMIFFFFLVFLFLWCRGSLPRYRYDLLMSFSWNVLLPFSSAYMMIMIMP